MMQLGNRAIRCHNINNIFMQHKRLFSIASSNFRCNSFPLTTPGSKRGIGNILFDYSWAVEPLKKRGLELKVSPKTEDDAKDEAVIDNPPEHINELVDRILCLDIAEIFQLQRRLHVFLLL